MTTAVAPMPRDLKSFRLAKPVGAEFAGCTFLSLAVCGIWLFVLPRSSCFSSSPRSARSVL